MSRLSVDDERAKPRLIAMLFCDYLNQTGDGKTNLSGVFDRVYVNKEKKKTPRFGVFIRTAETLTEPITLSVFSPSKKLLIAFHFSGDIAQFEAQAGERPADYPKQIQAILGMEFAAEEEGVYWFDISYKGSSIGGAGLPIEYIKEGDQVRATDTYI